MILPQDLEGTTLHNLDLNVGNIASVDQLKNICRECLLQVSGTKFDLILRIFQHENRNVWLQKKMRPLGETLVSRIVQNMNIGDGSLKNECKLTISYESFKPFIRSYHFWCTKCSLYVDIMCGSITGCLFEVMYVPLLKSNAPNNKNRQKGYIYNLTWTQHIENISVNIFHQKGSPSTSVQI